MRLPSEAEHFGGSGLRFALGVWRMAEMARRRPSHAMGGGAACERRIFGRRALRRDEGLTRVIYVVEESIWP